MRGGLLGSASECRIPGSMRVGGSRLGSPFVALCAHANDGQVLNP